jgi:DNA-binding NarL/FixJ family response regulator
MSRTLPHRAAATRPSAAEPSAGRDAARVIIVSDVRLFREGLAHSLMRERAIEVAGVYGSADEAISALHETTPDVVLCDISQAHGLTAVRRLVAAQPPARIVAFAVAPDESDVVACAEAGIAGYVPRDGTVDDLVRAVEHATRGEALCSPRVAGNAFRRLARLSKTAGPPATGLSPRELEIVGLIDEGLSNKQIARRLVITVATVKNHVHNILEKLNVRRRTEAAEVLRRLDR